MSAFDAFRFDGKRVLVVGGATGMGAAAAELALDLGAEVVVMDHAAVTRSGVKAIHVDLSKEASIDAAVDACGGPVHVLLPCAGVADGTPGIERINFIGHRHLIDRMLDAGMLGRGAAIGFISSAAGLGWEAKFSELTELLDTPGFDSAVAWVEKHGMAHYMATKQAICAYVAREAFPLLKRGIRINAICPGPTDTPLAQANKDLWLAFGADFRGETGIQASTPKEQAYPLLFLCSDAATAINGITLITDAGYLSSGITGSFPNATVISKVLMEEAEPMYVALDELLHCLDLENVGTDTWEGRNPEPDLPHLFGGQLLAQGLVAAHRSLGGGVAHSLHASFLRRGTAAKPVDFVVQSLRAGRSIRTGTVTAIQDDVAILQMTVSYHEGGPGPSHQFPMEAAGEPDGEVYEEALARAMRHVRGFDVAGRQLPLEIRGVGGIGIFSEETRPPIARCWMRTRGALPDDPLVHQCLFAYASDYPMMMPVLNPHPVRIPALQSTSLDHAIWFHGAFRMDQWVLFELDSPVSGAGRGIARGLLYTQSGELVGSCVQEALLRMRAAGDHPFRPARRMPT